MPAVALSCPSCKLGAVALETPGAVDTGCDRCGVDVRGAAFPVLFRHAESVSAARSQEAEATCYHHPNNRASGECDLCGRYLCAICAVTVGQRTVCPSCALAGTGPGEAGLLQQNRVLYERIALVSAVLSTIIFYFAIVSAPAVFLTWALRRRSPGSMLGGKRWRWALALTISVLQLVGIAALVVAIVAASGQ